MESAELNDEKVIKGSGPWPYVAFIFLTTFFVTPIAGGFFVPIGESSYVQLPGVILFFCLAVVCSWLFVKCPVQPLWGKILTLLLSLPALGLAVYTILYYIMFGLAR